MIEILTDVPPGVVAVRARGTLTRDEYDSVVLPMLDEAERSGRRLRILCEVGADYRGLTRARCGRTFGSVPARCTCSTHAPSSATSGGSGRRPASRASSCPVRCASSPSATAPRPRRGSPRCPRPRASPSASTSRRARWSRGRGTAAWGRLRCARRDRRPVAPDPRDGGGRRLPRPHRAGLGERDRSAPAPQFVREHHRRVRRVALAVDGVLPASPRPWRSPGRTGGPPLRLRRARRRGRVGRGGENDRG